MNQFPDSFFSYIADALTRMMSQNAGFFQASGTSIYRAVLLMVAALYFGETMLHGSIDGRRTVKLVFMVLLCSMLVNFYSTPAPFLGQSFHGVFTDASKYYSEKLEAGQDQALQMRLNEVVLNMESPTVSLGARWAPVIYYFMIVALIAVMRFALIYIVGIGFLALGVATVLGPLFIPWIMFPGLEFLFWGWFKSFLSYAMYQVVAAAMVNIVATCLITFFDRNNIHAISLANLEVIFIELSVILLVGIFGMFKAPSIASSIMTGHAGEGLWRI